MSRVHTAAGAASSPTFAERVIEWQRRHGRHDLPWQRTREPYPVWLSEIMLQQTQVSAVIPYYERFLATFPTIADLARAEEDQVLRLWSGLGYYSRARNLHRAARMIADELDGRFPDTRAGIEALPGIGRSTAAAIAVFAFDRREAILDGNVKRVLARSFLVPGYRGERRVEEALWSLAESVLPQRDLAPYTQGLMDLGATRCARSRPQCASCPVQVLCGACAAGRTGEIPAPRPRKALPQRRTTMLVLRVEGKLMLEKRPGSGIWGGLWCFPEVSEDGVIEDEIRRVSSAHYGCTPLRMFRLPRIAHGFTHYALDIDPVLVDAERPAPVAAEPGITWIVPSEARQFGLPVPAKKIIAALIGPEQPLLFEETVQDL